MKYSNEQTKYIKHTKSCKLIACAGSGKTSCIIRKVEYCQKKYNKNEIMLTTFSRFAKQEFITRCKQWPRKYSKFLLLSNIRTIDSIAFNILNEFNKPKSKSIDVLSIGLYKVLQELKSQGKSIKVGLLEHIKYIFVDEAQDLNDIQYKIFMLLKTEIEVDFIGDPNQNIYHFRGSSDKYLLNYDVPCFYLTTNYRSTREIINFCSELRPVKLLPTKSYNKTGDKPLIIPMYKFDLSILDNYEYSDVAIISPKRKKGLSDIANMLYKNNIKFIQFYNENDELSKITYKPKKGHVNLLSYHGTKGLEWKLVIMMNCNYLLMNKPPSYIKNSEFEYLLYTASSRAIEKLVIVYEESIYPHIAKLDSSLYEGGSLKVKKLTYNEDNLHTNITDILKHTTPQILSKFDDLLTINFTKKRIYEVEVNNSDPTLFGKFVEELFILMINLNQQKPLKKYESINYLDLCVHCDIHVPKLTWDQYDDLKYKLNKSVRLVIETLDRKVPLQYYTFVNNYINVPYIKECYKKYLECTKYKDGMKHLFEIVLFYHCVDNGHTYHLEKKDKHYILENEELFTKMNILSKTWKLDQHSISCNLGSLIGIVDAISEDRVTEFKMTQHVTLKHFIQLYSYNLMLKKANKFKLLNFYGEEYDIIIECKDDMEFINLLLDVGNFEINMMLVYDLETTGLIKKSIVDNKLKIEYPEIIQISMKEYEREIPVINSFVKVDYIPPFIQKLTGIKSTKNSLPLKEMKQLLRYKLRNIKPLLIAHNGRGFDDLIMRHYKILKFEALDSMSFIGIKKLNTIYNECFGKDIENSHNAISDVNALIKILKYKGF